MVSPLPLFLGIDQLGIIVPEQGRCKLYGFKVSKVASRTLVVSRSPLYRPACISTCHGKLFSKTNIRESSMNPCCVGRFLLQPAIRVKAIAVLAQESRVAVEDPGIDAEDRLESVTSWVHQAI